MMRHYFKKNIKEKKALKKNECIEFLNIYKKDFTNVNWLRIKTFIFNEYYNNR